MKKIIAMILSLVLLLSITACANTKSSDAANGESREEELYTMVVFSKGIEYFNWTYAGFRDAAASIGSWITTEFTGPSEWDASAEARTVETVMAKGPNGIAVACADGATLATSINKAIDSNIATICFDTDSDTSKRLTFVGTNNYDFGALSGELIVDRIGTTGEVLLLTVPGNVMCEQRAQGCINYLEENAPDIVVTILNDEGEAVKAEQVVSAAIQSNPNVAAIATTHCNGAAGAAAAVRTLNKKDSICIVGTDYDSSAIELLMNGDLDYTVIDDPYLIGYETFMLLYAAAHPTEIVSSIAPGFGHVVAPISGGCSYLTGEMLKDPEVYDRYTKQPEI